MSKASTGPDLTKYMDKQLELQLTGRRMLRGTLRGFDQFMNIVLEGSQEVVSEDQQNELGTVVIRGNAIVRFECKQHVGRTVYNPKTR